MRNLLLAMIVMLAMVLSACQGNTDHTANGQAETSDQSDTLDFAPYQDAAICLWGVAGLREQPGRGGSVNDYLTSIYFGERVEMLGESEEVERERRTYIKIRLSDGQEGWVHQYLFAENATLGAITQEAKIYRRPDLMTLKDDVFEIGEIVAVSQQKDDWIKVSGKEKRKSGWIKGTSMISRQEEDVVVAVLYQRALQMSNPRHQLKELLSIVNNPDYSNAIFLDQVKAQLPIAEDLARIPDNQLYITARRVNVRSTPETSEDNVVLQLDEGAVCNVISKGSEVEVDEIKDYWYQIEVGGQQGWVYGHFTSKRLEP
jgi:SH3-like domain-containing protein